MDLNELLVSDGALTGLNGCQIRRFGRSIVAEVFGLSTPGKIPRNPLGVIDEGIPIL